MELPNSFRSYLDQLFPNGDIPEDWKEELFPKMLDDYPKDLIHYFSEEPLHRKKRTSFPEINWRDILGSGSSDVIYNRILTLPYPTLQFPLPKNFWPHEEITKEAYQFVDKPIDQWMVRTKGWRLIPLRMVTHPEPDPYCSKTTYSRKTGFPRDEVEINWTEESHLCPKTVNWIKNCPLFTNLDRISYYYLYPGGFIPPHRDLPEVGTGATGPNWALTHPKECYWLMEDWGFIDWKPGEAHMLDFGRKHSIVNLSNKTRIHMMITAEFDPDYFVGLYRQHYLGIPLG